MMQGQRKPWASPLGAEASTPGALLYHNRTPASPLNMLLLNGQPGQQNTPAKDVQAHSADVPSPPDPPTHSSAQQNGVIDSAHAEAAQKALPSSQVGSGAAKVSTEGGPQTSKQTAPAAAQQAAQPSVGAHAAAVAHAGPAESPAAPEALQRSSAAQPPPARKPKGKGFLGAEILAAQQTAPENDQGTSTCDQPAEHQSSPFVTSASRSTPAAAKPDAASNSPSASPAQAKAGQPVGPAPQESQEPALNKHSKQSSQTGEAEVSRQSPDLEIASVHQAVEAVQVRSACASTFHQIPPCRVNLCFCLLQNLCVAHAGLSLNLKLVLSYESAF